MTTATQNGKPHARPDSHADAYWVGYLSHGLLTALRFLDSSEKLARDDIRATLEAFMASPVCSPETRKRIRKEMGK